MELPLPLDIMAMIGFFVAVAGLLVYDRKNVEFHYGLIIRRWKRGNRVMDKWIFSHRGFLDKFGTVGVICALIGAGVGVGGILYSTFVVKEQAAKFILPTAGDFSYPTDVVLGVPFWFWLISIFVVLTVHEPMHAIFSRLAGVPVRSWGIMTFLTVPIGAFVDPDMKKVYSLKLSDKLKIFAGGSFGNFIAGGFFILLSVILTFYIFNVPIGQVWDLVPPNSTLALQETISGDIMQVNGVDIGSMNHLGEVLSATEPGSTINVVTSEGAYDVVGQPNQKGDGSLLGVTFRKNEFYWTLGSLLQWLILFNIGIGIFNTLPLRPFDGGHIFHALYERWLKDKRKAELAINITSVAVLGIIIFGFFGAKLLNGLI